MPDTQQPVSWQLAKRACLVEHMYRGIMQERMQVIKKYWYLTVLLLTALVINENVIHWFLAIKAGGLSVIEGFKEAFKYFSFLGYLFFTAFRLVPYVGLGIILGILSKTKFSDFVPLVFIGGLVGILAMIIWGSWTAQSPLYTDEHISSTSALAFIFIPMYSVPSGAAGAILFALLYMPFRFVNRESKSVPNISGDV